MGYDPLATAEDYAALHLYALVSEFFVGMLARCGMYFGHNARRGI